MSAFKTWLAGLTSKATPADADAFHITDSAASGASKRVTLTNLWANYIKSKADALYAAALDLASHTGNTSNPHSVTATQVGLGSVTNDAQTKAAIVPNTAPSAGQLLVGNAGGTAYAPVAVSGDATLASTGALTLANTAVSAGSYKNADITVDAKGRVTAASSGSQCIPVACSDETTALTAGTGKVTFRMPYAFTLTAVRASLTTAQTGGSIFTVDINEAGTSVLSTKLTIDNTEKTSTTAASAAVISDSSLADDAEITIDIDQIGDGTAKGLKVYLIGSRA